MSTTQRTAKTMLDLDIDVDTLLASSEDLEATPTPATTAWKRLSRRAADSTVAVVAATLLTGLLVAAAVAATTASVGERPAPSPAPLVASMVEGPSTGDARRGISADADTLRSGGAPTLFSPDSADSADRRASQVPAPPH